MKKVRELCGQNNLNSVKLLRQQKYFNMNKKEIEKCMFIKLINFENKYFLSTFNISVITFYFSNEIQINITGKTQKRKTVLHCFQNLILNDNMIII